MRNKTACRSEKTTIRLSAQIWLQTAPTLVALRQRQSDLWSKVFSITVSLPAQAKLTLKIIRQNDSNENGP